MSRYRIKTESSYDGTDLFQPQKRCLWFWCDFSYARDVLEEAEKRVIQEMAKDSYKSYIAKEFD